MKRTQPKEHKIGTYEIDKTSLSSFNDKRYVLNDAIHTCLIFIKIVIIEKYYNHWKVLWWLKSIMMIEEYYDYCDCYDDWRVLWWLKSIMMIVIIMIIMINMMTKILIVWGY